MATPDPEEDLYDILSLPRTATKSEIKKAYHRAALSSHPDKVPESDRAGAEIRFKAVSRAYEILSDDQTRSLYDEHGMAAFEKGNGGAGGPGGVDMEDIINQMFGGMGGGFTGMHGGFGGGGMGEGMPGGPGGARGGKRKGRPEVQEYEVTLEELYKGKTTKFASTKNVICPSCSGSGGKEKAKSKKCGSCEGKGTKTVLRPIGPGLVTQEAIPCSTCAGRGSYFADKDKCKKCKGQRTVSQRKILELYIPRGAREGEKVVLAGEADQVPDQEPGDLVFEITEKEHETFVRAGADLTAELEISLAEALTGFNRVVCKHLDGRGLRVEVKQPHGKVLRPDDVLLVKGEGMPVKRSDERGDLYLRIKVKFPEDGWLKDEGALKKVRDVLPQAVGAQIKADLVDEINYEVIDNMDGFGAGSGDPRAGAEWEDEEDGEGEEAQCAQQ